MATHPVNLQSLKLMTETPSVGTACGPIVSVLSEFFNAPYTNTLIPDGFCLFQKAGAQPEQLKAVFIAHMDEIGGCAYGERLEVPRTFLSRFWGTSDPQLYIDTPLQAMDYLEQRAENTFPIGVEAYETEEHVQRLALYGEPIRPYCTVFTFRRETVFDEHCIYAKAVDPRVTLYAICEAVRRLDDPGIGALIVMA